MSDIEEYKLPGRPELEPGILFSKNVLSTLKTTELHGWYIRNTQ